MVATESDEMTLYTRARYTFRITEGNHFAEKTLPGFLLLACALGGFAQTNPSTPGGRAAAPPHPAAAAPKVLQVVAGIVGSDGTVKYLPRVQVLLMPKGYKDVESVANAFYKSEMDAASADREKKVAVLIQERRDDLNQARQKYASELSEAIGKVTIIPLQAAPNCVTSFATSNFYYECRTNSTFDIHLSDQFRAFLTSAPILGPFKPDTFLARNAPGSRDLKAAMATIPFRDYLSCPEFERAAKFVVKKNSKSLKQVMGTDSITSSTVLSDEVSSRLSGALANVWVVISEKANTDFSSSTFITDYFHGLPSGAVDYLLKRIESATTQAVDHEKFAVLSRYIAEKDKINHHYDSLQREADDAMNAASDSAEKKLTNALAEARRTYRPLQETTTSLQGQTTIAVPSSGGILYAEDMTTDRHLKWAVPIIGAKVPKTLELTDANAIPVTSRGSTAVAKSAENAFPSAKNLTDEQRDEYHLRYGTRLMRSWELQSTAYSLTASQHKLILDDTPMGFGFGVIGASTDVFNTLRMDDSKIAVRFFKDLVIPFLQGVPSDLKATGGENAFEAVGVSISGSKKDFSQEYAVGKGFTINYVFRTADVESFVAQKIDTQQLLDRGHISQDGVGRISLKYTASE